MYCCLFPGHVLYLIHDTDHEKRISTSNWHQMPITCINTKRHELQFFSIGESQKRKAEYYMQPYNTRFFPLFPLWVVKQHIARTSHLKKGDEHKKEKMQKSPPFIKLIHKQSRGTWTHWGDMKTEFSTCRLGQDEQKEVVNHICPKLVRSETHLLCFSNVACSSCFVQNEVNISPVLIPRINMNCFRWGIVKIGDTFSCLLNFVTEEQIINTL